MSRGTRLSVLACEGYPRSKDQEFRSCPYVSVPTVVSSRFWFPRVWRPRLLCQVADTTEMELPLTQSKDGNDAREESHSKTECCSRVTQGRAGGKTKMLPARGPRVGDRPPGSPRRPATALPKSRNFSKIVSIRGRLAILSKFS